MMNVKLCVLFVLACTFLRSAQAIIGADPVKIEDFSYNVIVRFEYTFENMLYHYSGSVIHKRFILTYGGYFVDVIWNDDKSSVKSIRLKSIKAIQIQALTNVKLDDNSKFQKNEIIAKVKTLHYPPECFDSNRTHGRIVILELENDLDTSRGIQILKLSTMDLNYMKDYEKFAIFTSFGRHVKETFEVRLRSMEVAVVDCPKTSLQASDTSTFCGGSIILNENINNSHNQSLGVWRGDIGGPLVYRKHTIIGMMVKLEDGDDRLGQNTKMSFLNISHHFNFINDVITGQPSLHVKAAIPLS